MADEEQQQQQQPPAQQQEEEQKAPAPVPEQQQEAAPAVAAAAAAETEQAEDPNKVDENFDAIVCGTGLSECILSGMLATHGYKVLHLDRNPYYGGETASLNLEQLFEKFGKGKPPAELGRNHLYNVDLIPKVLMSAGELVKILRTTVVERYSLEFMLLESSFVKIGSGSTGFFGGGNTTGIEKVPVTPSEAWDSKLMGLLEKRRCGNFLGFIAEYSEKVELEKIRNKKKGYDLRTMTSMQLFQEYGLEPKTITFIGHAVALYTNDNYLNQPAYDMVMRCKLYVDSLMMYGSSPYVYPLYGSGELPQAFSRLCAVYGGTYMLQTPVHKVLTDASGKFESIQYGDGLKAKAKFILGDASYFPDRVRKVGQVVRCIAIMNHPINTGQKEPSKSLQIVIPQSELNRKSDVFVLQLSSENQVCPPGFFIAIVGTTVENPQNPAADLEGGLRLLGPTLHTFVKTTDLFQPLDDGVQSKIFITNSYDAETHFESASKNVLELFQRIHGKPYDFEAAQKANEAGTIVKS